jgi:hypothetical protein
LFESYFKWEWEGFEWIRRGKILPPNYSFLIPLNRGHLEGEGRGAVPFIFKRFKISNEIFKQNKYSKISCHIHRP